MSDETPTLRVTVLTALPVETTAMLAQLESSTAAMTGDVVEQRGLLRAAITPCEITCIELGPGNIETALEAGRVRADARTDILLFVGIAASLKDLSLGDVVAASEIVWLHRAKVVEGEVLPRAQVQPCSRELVSVARYTVQRDEWQARVPETAEATRSAFVGQIVSCEELVKDGQYRDELKRQYSDALAIENEGYGLAKAGGRSMRVLVIRGASDYADETKSDTDQKVAANSAAAFAAEFMNNYLALATPPPRGTPSSAPKATEEDSAARAEDGVSTAYDRAAMTIEALVTDSDLIGDEASDIDEFALRDYASADDDLQRALIELICAEVDDVSGKPVSVRLRGYGRTFTRAFYDAGRRMAWDELLQRHVPGAAVLAAQPAVLTELGVTERRRVLTALIGNDTSPRDGTPIGWRYLRDLLAEDALTEAEAHRVTEAMLRTPYAVLAEAGLTLTDLRPKLLADLSSGDFHAQNRAARYLKSNSSNALSDADQPAEIRGELAAQLLSAASGGAFGAQEATTSGRMAEWPADVMASALWRAISRDGKRLDSPSEGVKTVLAAATLASSLQEVLEELLRIARAADLAAVTDLSAVEDRAWLLEQGKKLPEDAFVKWGGCVDELYTFVPRK